MESDERKRNTAAGSSNPQPPPARVAQPRQTPDAQAQSRPTASGVDSSATAAPAEQGNAKQQTEIEALRAEIAEMRKTLGEAALRKLVPNPTSPQVLKHPVVVEPLVEMTLMDKGIGEVFTGGQSGFERLAEFGAVFTTPESSGRQLWNRDYATPTDRRIIERWKKDNERDRVAAMSEKRQLQTLLDKVHYHDKVRAPDTVDHIPVV